MSTTAPPCKAMFRVAANSQRDDHVARRIHKLHAIQQSVIAIRVVRAMSVAFEPRCTQQSIKLQRWRVTPRFELGELRRTGSMAGSDVYRLPQSRPTERPGLDVAPHLLFAH